VTDIRVGIVGLGRVGAVYPDIGDQPRCHLSAARMTPGLSVTVLVDRDEAACRRALNMMADEHPLCLSDVSELPAGAVDILVDATDEPNRLKFLRAAVKQGAALAILEKPVAASLEKIDDLRHVETGPTTVRVNFHRRLDGRHRRLRPGEPPRLVQAVYCGGLMNYGTHLVDLVHDWMGSITAVRALASTGDTHDPTIGFDMAFESGATGRIDALPNPGWDVFEIRFFGAFGRIDLTNGGADAHISVPAEDHIYAGYTHLAEEAAGVTRPVGGLAELYAAAWDHIKGGTPMPGATLEDAARGMAVIEGVRRSASDGGSWITVRIPGKTKVEA
jgi:predicted dehydrogenase